MNSTPTPLQRVLAKQTLLRTTTGITVIIAALAVVIVPVILLRTEPAWIPLLVVRIETWHAVISCAAAVALLQQKTWARIALVALGAICAPSAVLSLLWLNWPAFATTGVFALAAVTAYKLEPPQHSPRRDHDDLISVPHAKPLPTGKDDKPFNEIAYQNILGDELLALRRRRGWTRENLRQHLQDDTSPHTLGFYEQGAHDISVVRLADLCYAMGEQPHDLLARVHNRLDQPAKILLDLARVTASTHPDLQPLRNWARERCANQSPESPPAQTIQVDLTAFDAMATLCGMTTTELTDHLHRTTP